MATSRCAVSSYSCLKAQLRRGERTLRSPTWVGCQSDGALQERGSGGDASARLRAAGGSFQLTRDRLVGCGGGRGQMPCPTVWIDFPIGRLGQCEVHLPALIGSRRSMTREADAGRWRTTSRTPRSQRRARAGACQPRRSRRHQASLRDDNSSVRRARRRRQQQRYRRSREWLLGGRLPGAGRRSLHEAVQQAETTGKLLLDERPGRCGAPRDSPLFGDAVDRRSARSAKT